MTNEGIWPDGPYGGITYRQITANGLPFDVAVAGQGKRFALCLHGFPELNFSWRHQMPMLAERGWRVWAPNLRGYGNSGRPRGIRSYGLDHLCADIAALIDAANAEDNVEEIMIVAHDWGAIIAWHFAIHKIRPLTRLVIMNVPHPMVGAREIRKFRQLWRSWYIFFFQLPFLPEWMLGSRGARAIKGAFANMAVDKSRFPEHVLQFYADAAKLPGALHAMVNYYRALLRYPKLRNAGDGLVDVPTLMIWGEEDSALNIHCTQGTENWVADFELHRIPRISHWVQQEAPEKVNEILKNWLVRRD